MCDLHSLRQLPLQTPVTLSVMKYDCAVVKYVTLQARLLNCESELCPLVTM